jgi:hypothetical protein
MVDDSLWSSITAFENQFDPTSIGSSLVWPDSADLFQSLISGDGTNSWSQAMSGGFPLMQLPSEFSTINRTLNYTNGGSEAVEDGQRAVETTSTLLNETIHKVTGRVDLSKLTPRFLDSSLHMFFTRFVPIMPVIHRPTFVYRECSAPLLLNAIALGSLFIGSDDATDTGEVLWRLAHTAIATAWPDMISHRGEYDSCSGVQLVLTALLSQAYASLSRNQTLRTTSQTFYGLSMHWAQYCGLYEITQHEVKVPQLQDSIQVKQNAWKTWVAQETRLRTLLGLCVIDGVVSQFSGNLVNTWLATKYLPLASDDDAFEAETVDEWIEVMNARRKGEQEVTMRFCNLYPSLLRQEARAVQPFRLSNLFNTKVVLEILAALANDMQRTERGRAGLGVNTEILQALGTLRRYLWQSASLRFADKSIALIRWHSLCLDNVVSTARGARRMCKHFGVAQNIFGGRKRQEPVRIEPLRWTRDVAARKCLLHALEIHRIASQVPLGTMHDTCLPGALFAAATTYSSFALPGVSKVLVPTVVNWDTVVMYGQGGENARSDAQQKDDTLAFLRNRGGVSMSGWVSRNLAYELGSIRILLHNLSQHWGVAREMEQVIVEWELRCG